MKRGQRNIYLSILRAVAREVGITQAQVRAAVEAVFRHGADAVKYEGRFHLPPVGVFTATTRKARTVRHPATRELMEVPAMRSVRFRPAKRGVFR